MTKMIQSTVRSLSVLTEVNRHNDSTVAEITKYARLPRGTVFRILETLRKAGYLEKNKARGTYRLTNKVKWLSDGFQDLDAFEEAAKPIIHALAEKVLWPVTLTTPRGQDLVSRVTTDLSSPFAEVRNSPGLTVNLLRSAAGFAYLANCDAKTRTLLLRDYKATTTLTAAECDKLMKLFESNAAKIRKEGVAYFRGLQRSAAISVPIIVSGEVKACLSMRFYASALTEKEWRLNFLPLLKETAALIREIL